jgi:predicted RNA binding protein YcfA (HicA-like mRNA interferase family)
VGRLAGFRYRDIVRRLKDLGFQFDRQARGSHEIWFNPATRRYTTIPNHPGDMPEGTLRAILKQAGVTPDAFLSKRCRSRPVAAGLLDNSGPYLPPCPYPSPTSSLVSVGPRVTSTGVATKLTSSAFAGMFNCA